MPNCLKDLTAEYEALVGRLDRYVATDGSPASDALRHILRRLGPPSLTEASEIERREAIAADGE